MADFENGGPFLGPQCNVIRPPICMIHHKRLRESKEKCAVITAPVSAGGRWGGLLEHCLSVPLPKSLQEASGFRTITGIRRFWVGACVQALCKSSSPLKSFRCKSTKRCGLNPDRMSQLIFGSGSVSEPNQIFP